MLTLCSHPLASYCHKVLIALYESGTPFEAVTVDLADPGAHAAFLDLWPVGKMLVLRDAAADRVVPESSITIEYLDRHHPGHHPLLPTGAEEQLETRLWDSFFDLHVQDPMQRILHVQDPMQRIVFDAIRPEGERNPADVTAAEARLRMAYEMIETRMTGRDWVAGGSFSMADCAAEPALFYAGILLPWDAEQAALDAYLERLSTRPSVGRVLEEARPWFDHFPFADRIPARCRQPEA